MTGRPGVVVLSLIGLLSTLGCSRTALQQPVALDAGSENPADRPEISGIQTKSGKTVQFDKTDLLEVADTPTVGGALAGSVLVVNDSLHATVNQMPYSIAVSDIEYVLVEKSNSGNIAVGTVATALLAAATFFFASLGPILSN